MRSNVRAPPLFNGLDLVRWNIRKTYLRDLAERGVPVVPTIWRDRLHSHELPELIEEVGTAEMVIKPVIGECEAAPCVSTRRARGADPMKWTLTRRPRVTRATVSFRDYD